MISPATVPVEQGLSYPEMQGSIDTPCLPYLYYNIFPVQYLVCDLNI